MPLSLTRSALDGYLSAVRSSESTADGKIDAYNADQNPSTLADLCAALADLKGKLEDMLTAVNEARADLQCDSI